MHTENKERKKKSKDDSTDEVGKKEERSAALQEVSISQKSVAFLLKL
jgi:hypothetical protein